MDNDSKISGDFPNGDTVLVAGLLALGYGPKKLSRRTQTKRFNEHFGCRPHVCAIIWHDLKTGQHVPEKTTLHHLFWALFFLRKYPTEGDLASRFQKDPITLRKWIWVLIFGIQELKADRIEFPKDGDRKLKFIVSVDGTDCRIREPRPISRTWFSQKFHGPAVKYEVAIDVLTGHCVWINGPFKGSKNDLTIFREGLMALIPDGFLAVANKAYKGEPTKVSFPNHLDDLLIRRLKSRIRARQETFNARLKSFAVLDNPFRHKPVMEKHKACFEAVAVIVQYGIENGSPLFAI